MKTLDEVITEMEDEGLFTDALYYLREYRAEKANLEIIKSNYQDAIANCEKAENKFKTALKKLDIGTLNDPLTWDELKQMEGKPVWVEVPTHYDPSIGKYSFRGWEVIVAFSNGWMKTTALNRWSKDDLGKTWQAYRKERE